MVTEKKAKKTKPKAASSKGSSGLRSFVGIWKDIDTDKMIEEIYKRRREAPLDKPVKL